MNTTPSEPASQRKSERGVALILVLLALLVLSVLAAAMVFSARSDTLASYNYKLDTQADYLAKAGIQQALDFFRSHDYQPVLNAQAATYYDVKQINPLFNLYDSEGSPLNCISGCASGNSQVQLIGITGSGSSNYPGIDNSSGIPVTTAFVNDLSGRRVSGDANNSGMFSVNAVLIDYRTVNAPFCVPSWIAPPCPVETWLVTSRGVWTGGSGSSTRIAKAVETAIIQPVFTPTWNNALYGYCSVSMAGSAGTCTDSFNSALGPYGGGSNATASGACDSASQNVIAAGAGVGANGSVSLSSNVTVSGNVTIGTNPTPSCPLPYGYSGSVSSVKGEVVNGPHVVPPAVPTFPDLSAAPSFSGSAVLPNGGNGQPCESGFTCSGTSSNPYLINTISLSGGGSTVTLTGGPNFLSPVYFDIYNLNESGKGQIVVLPPPGSTTGYVVLNVESSLSITGNGVTNPIGQDLPPEAVQINFAGTSASIGGNGAISALISAPNATVTLGGGGSKGYMVGAIQANNISDLGGYPVHYDIQLNLLGKGVLAGPLVSAYSRKKF
ncbi:MAG: hypothetical protein KGM47_04650 [Acidobacteriota bacterium]|nr:hypothetical protein [Acidobacteriota bacterium]